MRLPQLGQDGVFPPTPVLIRVAVVGVGTGLATGETTVCRRGRDNGLVGAAGLGDAAAILAGFGGRAGSGMPRKAKSAFIGYVEGSTCLSLSAAGVKRQLNRRALRPACFI
jgi:hypothetical protein